MAYLSESHIEIADILFFTIMLGYSHIDGWKKQLLDRKSLKEVVLKDWLKESLVKLNDRIPESCIDFAIGEITKSRATMSTMLANK